MKIEQIINNIDARNWRITNNKIKPIYSDILHMTEFLPKTSKINERFYCILNNITSRPLCKTCKLNFVKYIGNLKGYKLYCSHKCSTNNEKVKEKAKQTCLKKYGKHPQQIKEIREKAKQTCLKKYGVEFATQSNQFKKNRKITCLKKYGVDEFSKSKQFKQQIPQIMQKYKQTCLKKYGVEHPQKNSFLKSKWKNSRLTNFYKNLKTQINPSYTLLFNIISYDGCKKEYQWSCNKCNNIFTSNLKDGSRPICPICFPNVKSTPQKELFEYINLMYKNEIVKTNTRSVIPDYELDIYIPHKQIAIELNGNYWHAENAGNKNKNYHLNKTQLCENRNIRLIHIFEDEWGNKQRIVKTRLRYILGNIKYKIYARKCEIKQIDVTLKNKFLNKYHIQGTDKSLIKLGAFYKNKLIAVMTFGKRKITGLKQLQWELIRYCTVSNFKCIGVASKLLTYFERNIRPKQLITYADRRWSQGNMYYKLGFKLDHTSSPNYWYMDKNYLQRYHRVGFQKHKLQYKLKNYDPTLSEWKNMLINKYDRIWDCGNMVFKKLY